MNDKFLHGLKDYAGSFLPNRMIRYAKISFYILIDSTMKSLIQNDLYLLKGKKFHLSGCTTNQCLIEIGKVLNA